MRAAVMGAFAAALLATACGEERVAPPASPEEHAAAPAAQPAPAGVAEGEFVVSVVGGRVQLASRTAPRLEILQRLADLEAFELESGGVEPRDVTLQLEDAPLATAVAALLDDTSYRAAYQYDEELGRNRLVSLRAGSALQGPDAAVAGRSEPGDVPDRHGALRRQLARLAAGEAPSLDEDEQRWLEALDSTDDRERLEAAQEIYPEGPALARLIELSASDPDPLVRAAAITTLEDSGTFAATQAMLRALGDRDPQVLLTALEALEFAGDESVIPQIRPLCDHSDGRVRVACQDAIEFLE